MKFKKCPYFWIKVIERLCDSNINQNTQQVRDSKIVSLDSKANQTVENNKGLFRGVRET